MASSSSSSAAAAGADDLDQLLDSALDDFTSFDLSASAAPKSGAEASGSGSASASALGSGGKAPVKGLGIGLPDPKAPRRRAVKQPQPPPRGAYASEALEKLTRETREAVRGLETATEGVAGLEDDAMMEEFVKQFEEFAGAQDMDSIVETMLQQLLSKEILHDPMKDIVGKYPKWLEDNKDKISKEEYERYNNQLELMVKLIEVYENDPKNMTKIFDIMQNMQACGQPPSDLVQDIVPDLDLSKLGQLSPEMLESAPNCCVM
ncbi:peroxisome biogenesis protein 19-1-like [Phragmites australis]|uniref:peroxisome biogenesis protein 19-1-like n=1 Tax=Phragmites australis TaxID=29695 RepID=UPI002D7897E2|nr:peroxisome biogenesis protein 19-1-like [Phragmites australis]